MSHHWRAIDARGVVHYVDHNFYLSIAGWLHAPWCLSGQGKLQVAPAQCLSDASRSSRVVTCIACISLRMGVRRG